MQKKAVRESEKSKEVHKCKQTGRLMQGCCMQNKVGREQEVRQK